MAPPAILPAQDDGTAARLGLRVLLAEDVALNQTVARSALLWLGCSVTLASAPAEILARAVDQQVVLINLDATSFDGWAMVQRLRDAGHHQPVVGLTREGIEPDPARSAGLGIVAVLPLPLDERQLRAVLSPLRCA
jgi:two-component system response regulator TctD